MPVCNQCAKSFGGSICPACGTLAGAGTRKKILQPLTPNSNLGGEIPLLEPGEPVKTKHGFQFFTRGPPWAQGRLMRSLGWMISGALTMYVFVPGKPKAAKAAHANGSDYVEENPAQAAASAKNLEKMLRDANAVSAGTKDACVVTLGTCSGKQGADADSCIAGLPTCARGAGFSDCCPDTCAIRYNALKRSGKSPNDCINVLLAGDDACRTLAAVKGKIGQVPTSMGGIQIPAAPQMPEIPVN